MFVQKTTHHSYHRLRSGGLIGKKLDIYSTVSRVIAYMFPTWNVL